MNHRWKTALLGIAVAMVTIAGCYTPPPVVVTGPSHASMNAESHLRQGMTYVNQGDFNNAVLEFQKSIRIRPTAKAYSNLGVAYMQLGKRNLALEALKRAESLSPNDHVALYNLAALYSLMDQTDVSLVYLDRALSRGFSNYDAIRFDADLENIRGEPEFRKILEKHKVFIQ